MLKIPDNKRDIPNSESGLGYNVEKYDEPGKEKVVRYLWLALGLFAIPLYIIIGFVFRT